MNMTLCFSNPRTTKLVIRTNQTRRGGGVGSGGGGGGGGGGGELDCSHLLFPSVKGVLQWSKSLFGNKRKIG